ncbi:hypothetical protein GCM10011360_17760 [Primorskyibacter flagellatus]|uniref:Uncharacterized protein n=2 Tax=Primorskyibacter flagellatus TaxID=1387277 RepID=A0A917A6A9_9RHOB|nr:hypothetical protein GCM10011360_17760 [Primorskyibacter flagellatus]
MDVATQCGLAVGKSGDNPKAWSVGLGQGRSEAERFSNVLRLTHGLIETHDPDLIVVEAFIGGKNASAYLIGLVACVRGCAFNRGVKVEMVFPATVRKHFLGKAYTSKDFPHLKREDAKLEIKRVVKRQCEAYGWDIPDLDAADAAATWNWACTEFAGQPPLMVGGLF